MHWQARAASQLLAVAHVLLTPPRGRTRTGVRTFSPVNLWHHASPFVYWSRMIFSGDPFTPGVKRAAKMLTQRAVLVLPSVAQTQVRSLEKGRGGSSGVEAGRGLGAGVQLRQAAGAQRTQTGPSLSRPWGGLAFGLLFEPSPHLLPAASRLVPIMTGPGRYRWPLLVAVDDQCDSRFEWGVHGVAPGLQATDTVLSPWLTERRSTAPRGPAPPPHPHRQNICTQDTKGCMKIQVLEEELQSFRA